ncbi:MAG: hypothetical protein CVV25_04665 [Ignavibacteriae bacterium HGW-Ignavibacteriae-4]|nr:MAG: hypothetical protein CVV25_04665 [Ignavibacteriae bacterium HGW-Ignavibacteriae-4]
MTNIILKEYIDVLNSNEIVDSIYRRQISSNVEIAKDWRKKFSITDKIIVDKFSYKYFFIKDENGRYIGIVMDMGFDLYWYVLKEFRNKGYMSKALKESIIPYFFNKENRSSLTISIDRIHLKKECYKSSKNMALNLGFKLIKGNRKYFELMKSDFNFDNNKLSEQNSMVSNKRLNELREEVFYAHKILSKVSDELLMAYGDDSALAEISEYVKEYKDIIKEKYIIWNEE